MFSVGTDLIEIKRIEKSIQNEYFMQKIFGPDEIEELGKRKNPPESVAAAFAAKEAFSKAIGTGVRGFSMCEVQLLHDDMGAPYFKFLGRAKDIVDELEYNFSVSLTHTAQLASATVIAYK
ncbi:MAG: holo-ACP synthase [Clostridia bacterium]|nr:holo-ACP synthase [Clostridia bacterium]